MSRDHRHTSLKMITLNSSYVGSLHVVISRIIKAVQVHTGQYYALTHMLKRRNRHKIVALAYVWLK